VINLYDLQGKQLKAYVIENLNEGEIQIPGFELQPGIYIYNLVVDGMEITSRRMVITN